MYPPSNASSGWENAFDESRHFDLTFWAKNDTNKVQTAIYEKAIRDFEALYPNISVTMRLYTDYGRIYNDVITNIATDTTPNICITYPDHIATYLSGENTVLPLEDLAKDPRFGMGGSELRFDGPRLDEVVPQFLNECRLGGALYALPKHFPFEKPDVVKRGIESMWNIEGDKAMMALAMTMSDRPMAVNMEFQREYAERYDWLKQQFTNWVFIFSTSFLYYEDYDTIDEDTRNLYRQSMAAFDGNAPSYHIALLDKPTIVWDFHSLLLGIQMMFSFMLTDEKTPLRLCRHCMKVFVASRPSNQFCSPECKNRHNVYKNRAKKKENE